MALIRSVRWNEVHPAENDIGNTLRDYVGAAGKVVWQDGRWFVTLPGKPSSSFRSLEGNAHRVAAVEQHDERWFEVFPDDNRIDVITRQADEFTNAVAKGFVNLCVCFWNGQVDDGA